jgi:hypothetical protein
MAGRWMKPKPSKGNWFFLPDLSQTAHPNISDEGYKK